MKQEFPTRRRSGKDVLTDAENLENVREDGELSESGSSTIGLQSTVAGHGFPKPSQVHNLSSIDRPSKAANKENRNISLYSTVSSGSIDFSDGSTSSNDDLSDDSSKDSSKDPSMDFSKDSTKSS